MKRRKIGFFIFSFLLISRVMFAAVSTRAETSTSQAQPFRVLLYNDEYHSIPEAAHILSTFLSDDRTALNAAVTAHSEGRAVVGEFSEEASAEALKDRIHSAGLRAGIDHLSV